MYKKINKSFCEFSSNRCNQANKSVSGSTSSKKPRKTRGSSSKGIVTNDFTETGSAGRYYLNKGVQIGFTEDGGMVAEAINKTNSDKHQVNKDGSDAAINRTPGSGWANGTYVTGAVGPDTPIGRQMARVNSQLTWTSEGLTASPVEQPNAKAKTEIGMNALPPLQMVDIVFNTKYDELSMAIKVFQVSKKMGDNSSDGSEYVIGGKYNNLIDYNAINYHDKIVRKIAKFCGAINDWEKVVTTARATNSVCLYYPDFNEKISKYFATSDGKYRMDIPDLVAVEFDKTVGEINVINITVLTNAKIAHSCDVDEIARIASNGYRQGLFERESLSAKYIAQTLLIGKDAGTNKNMLLVSSATMSPEAMNDIDDLALKIYGLNISKADINIFNERINKFNGMIQEGRFVVSKSRRKLNDEETSQSTVETPYDSNVEYDYNKVKQYLETTLEKQCDSGAVEQQKQSKVSLKKPKWFIWLFIFILLLFIAIGIMVYFSINPIWVPK